MTKVIEFRHQYDERLLEGTKEAFIAPSETEPDNSLSIPEIMAKFTRGLPPGVTQYQWTNGQSAPEDGFSQNDGTLEGVLEIQKPSQEPPKQKPSQEPPKQEPPQKEPEAQE